MENKTIIFANSRYILRSDTLENWEAANPILLYNEIVLVDDGKYPEIFKRGDGITPFCDLPYWPDTGFSIEKSSEEDSERTFLIIDGVRGSDGSGFEFFNGIILSHGTLHMCGEKVTNVAYPEDADDAANKRYVDAMNEELQKAVEDLEERANNGEFKGDPGPPGEDYLLTDVDKADIASLVLAEFTDVSEVGQ